MSTARQPAWFLAHGAPTLVSQDNATTSFWRQLPDRIAHTPRALLCLSAHWETDRPALAGGVSEPTIQYDFHGFPRSLYQTTWPLKGDAQTAPWLLERLTALDIELTEQADRPLDHGVWMPLHAAWPTPPFPVYQLSLCPARGAEWHLELGRRLAPLRQEGVLVIGSGGITHNLRRLDWHAPEGTAAPWATAFMDAVDRSLQAGDYPSLCAPWTLPHGRDCVPTMEHYLPLLVIAGICAGGALRPLFGDWLYGTLSMHSYGCG